MFNFDWLRNFTRVLGLYTYTQTDTLNGNKQYHARVVSKAESRTPKMDALSKYEHRVQVHPQISFPPPRHTGQVLINFL